MDDKIREYAAALYNRFRGEAVRTSEQETVSLRREMVGRVSGGVLSGIEYQGMIKIAASFVGRDMMAKLTSFHEAFGQAHASPSPEDFDQIWHDVRDTYQRTLQSRTRQLSVYAKWPRDSMELIGHLKAAAAHEHDRVLHEWKVWRGRATLTGIRTEPFAMANVPTLQKLVGKKELLEDVARLISGGQQVAVLYMDLDNFKSVNDTSGHADGDRCLEEVVRIVGAVVVGKGRLYRYAERAGDEFVIVLPNFDSTEAAATAERVRKAIDTENPGGSVKVTASLGVVVATNATHKSADEIVIAADLAMYKAKTTRNAVAT